MKHSRVRSVRQRCANAENGTSKKNIPEVRLNCAYEFLMFKTVIDDLPVAEIKQRADDYKERIAWDLWAGTVSLNCEIQKILIFWDFLDSQILPVGISSAEKVFYRKTASRMVREGFLPRYVMHQFKKTKSVRTPPDWGRKNLILSQAV